MLKGTAPLENDIRAVDWSNDGSFIIAGDVKGKIYLFDPVTLKIRSTV